MASRSLSRPGRVCDRFDVGLTGLGVPVEEEVGRFTGGRGGDCWAEVLRGGKPTFIASSSGLFDCSASSGEANEASLPVVGAGAGRSAGGGVGSSSMSLVSVSVMTCRASQERSASLLCPVTHLRPSFSLHELVLNLGFLFTLLVLIR